MIYIGDKNHKASTDSATVCSVHFEIGLLSRDESCNCPRLEKVHIRFWLRDGGAKLEMQ